MFGVHGSFGRRGEKGLKIPEEFISLKKGRFLLVAKKTAAGSALEAGVLVERDPVRWLGAGEPMSGGRGGVVPVVLPGVGSSTVMVKPLLRGGALRFFNRGVHFTAGRLFDEARLAVAVETRSVPAKGMIFGRGERILGPFYRLHLATERIEGAVTLLAFLKDCRHSDRERSSVLKAAGRAVRSLHKAGILHGDLNLTNLLVFSGPDFSVQVIDLDGTPVRPAVSMRRRCGNLARLLRHAVKNALHEERDLASLGAAFLSGYCEGEDPVPLKKRVLRSFARTLPFHRLSWRLQGITVRAVDFRSLSA